MGKKNVLEETSFEKRLDEIAKVLYSRGKDIAQKVMSENGFYEETFTPENFIDIFVGYALVSAANQKYIPKTAEEIFFMQDSKKFATYVMRETGIDLESYISANRAGVRSSLVS